MGSDVVSLTVRDYEDEPRADRVTWDAFAPFLIQTSFAGLFGVWEGTAR